MKKSVAVRVISFCAAAALVAVGFLIQSKINEKRYRLEIENNYSRSLDELNAGVNNIYLILQKAEFTTTKKQMSAMATKLLGYSENAKTALSQLPQGDNELTVLNRFLSQVGNYAMSVSQGITDDGKISEEFPEKISVLKETAQTIASAVSDSQISYNNTEYWAGELENRLDETVGKDSLPGTLGQLEDSLSDYPKLVYDGPYSDHIMEKEPLMLKNAKKVSESAALETAEKAAVTDKDKLNTDGIDTGKIPVYRFSNDSVSVTVSREGGYPVYMRKNRTVGDSILNYKQALDKAKRYLDNLSFGSFTETYYFTDEGVCVINFAFVDGVTVCYTDLVKIGVAMDTGEIMLLEASGYLTNHTERAFETPTVSEEDAAKAVSKKLKIKETALALIPTPGGGETRCYEFVCESDKKEEILVYINVLTREEEQILILLKSDGGTLTK